MASAIEERIKRLEAGIKRRDEELRQLRDKVAGLEQKQYGMEGAPSGGGGSAGVFYADHLNITSGATASSVTVKRSWDGTNDTTNGTVRNIGPDATTSTRRQYLAKNPDGSYSIVGQSCTNV